MKLVRQTKLHFKEGNSDKVYEVDLCESNGKYLVNFRYGRRGSDLKEGTKTTSPIELDEAEKVFQKLVDEKARKGYHIFGEQTETVDKPKDTTPKTFDEEARKNAILTALQHPNAKSNPRIDRIIWRAGELKIKEATPFLINLIGTDKELRDYCIVWSLGFCGNETTIPILEKLTGHKAEFIRRISREAILKLADETAKNLRREKTIAELPEVLRNLAKFGTPESFENALSEELTKPKAEGFNILTRVYEINNEITRPALLKLLPTLPVKPKYFRPLRHIFKMAEYRRDGEVFGIIAKRFETEAHNFTYYWNHEWKQIDGNWRQVERGDGLKTETSNYAYGEKTRTYFRRRTWRTLRRLGEIGDSDYVKMAVGSLLPFTDADAVEPRTSINYDYYHTGRYNWKNPKVTTVQYGKFAPYLLFNHVLYGNSKRFELKPGSRAFRLIHDTGDKAPSFREESFPKLWETQPVGLLHLLSESNCLPVHEFAVKALRDCQEFVANLDVEAILMLLERPYEITNKFGFELAKSRYDANNPNVELVTAVAVCGNAEARNEAFSWINARRDFFAKNNSVMLRLLTCAHQDTRNFASSLLQTTNYSETETQNLIAVLISSLLSFDETKREIAGDLGDTLLKSFGKALRTINFNVIKDLLSHPLMEVQSFGGNILLNHETPSENLPDALINSLIESPFEEIRTIGIRLFGQLPDDNLLKRESVIMSLLKHELADVHNATRPIVTRLSANYPAFTQNLANSIFIALLQKENHEGVHARLLEVLRELPDWTNYADLEIATLLVKSDSTEASEIGGMLLQSHADNWHENVSTQEIVDFTNHEVLAVRRASWQIAEKAFDRLRGEVSYLVRALDAKWDDSQEFWQSFFRTKLTAEELTPEVLVSVCDSVKEKTQKFGRDLLLHYFKEENGIEYLLKLSEHPSPVMQLFTTNYLENHAADAPDRLEKLAPYFVRVLSLVNRSRVAKTRSLQFLEREALKTESAAQIVSRILARQSATLAIGDKAQTIETMLKIRRKFPEIELPININPVEVRQNAV